MKYYNCERLLSKKDLNGNTPEIFLCTSNRSAGKTTSFGKVVFEKWLNGDIRKFGLEYYYDYELTGCAEKFFKELKVLFFNDWNMISRSMAHGKYHELFAYNDENPDELIPCGYAWPLNSAEQLKKFSHLLNDVDVYIHDEFMTESGRYPPNVINKFQSIHTTIARGGGQQSRYVPVYMISNPVTLMNPFYIALGVCDRIQKDTRFLRGNGWILECAFNESAKEAQEQSIFNRAFASSDYQAFAAQNVYLNDSETFIEKLSGPNKYLCTLVFEGKSYSIKVYNEFGYAYCDTTIDESYPLKLALTTHDHKPNMIMINSNKFLIDYMRKLFDQGLFRFKNLQCKKVIMSLISYSM